MPIWRAGGLICLLARIVNNSNEELLTPIVRAIDNEGEIVGQGDPSGKLEAALFSPEWWELLRKPGKDRYSETKNVV